MVLVDRDGSGTPFDSVAVDDVAGARLAVDHLCATGRRRIAFVSGPTELRQVRDRLRGAREAVAEVAGATLEVIETPALTVLEGRAAGNGCGNGRPVVAPTRCSAPTIYWPSACCRRWR